MNKDVRMFLIVDDDEWQREEINDILKDSYPEIEILFAANAEDGLKKVEHFFFRIDLVVIERHMYEHDDGLELVKKNKSFRHNLIILTDDSPPPIPNPADGFLKKPITKEKLKKEVNRLMNKLKQPKPELKQPEPERRQYGQRGKKHNSSR